MNILLTGGSKGLGLQITKTLLEAGHTVFSLSRTIGELDVLMQEYKNQIHFLSFDLSKPEDIKGQIFKDWIADNQIHGFVNNAAMAYDTLLTNMNLSQVQKMITINQISPMILTKYVIRNMLLHNTKGAILHISSVSAHTGYKGLSMYASTKGALEAFSKNAAREWGVKGIRSNCIAVGFMETDMTRSMSDAHKEKIYRRNALKNPTDLKSVADTVMYLLNESSNSVTGQVIHVDGGTI